jgi:O-antigen/teichoic acid export membrane protein
MNPVLRSAFARILSFVPAALATFATSHLVIKHYGVATFDTFVLIITLIALIPLNDLGVGAPVTSAYAARGPQDDYSRAVTRTALRTLFVSTLVVEVLSLGITVAGGWHFLLGNAAGPNLYCGIAAAVYGLSFVPGLGTSMLLGVHRNHVTVVVQTFTTPVMLAAVAAMIITGTSQHWVIVVPAVAVTSISLVTAAMAARATGLSWLQLLGEMRDRRQYPGARIRGTSGPRLLITTASPLALQSDRVVLSHVSTQQAVANYSVAMQIFAPVLGLIGAAAAPLWPIYERARAEGKPGPAVGRVLFMFVSVASAACVVLALLANPIGHLIGGSEINLGVLLPIACALSAITQAAAYPVAMSLMDERGIKFVGAITMIALPLNVGLSIVLAGKPAIGASGPLLATFAVGILVQTLPALYYGKRRADRPDYAAQHAITRSGDVVVADQ